MMLAHKCHKTLGKTNETDTQCTLVDDRGNGVVRLQFLAADPKSRHEQRELLRKGSLLELHALVQLTGSNLEQAVELCKEHCNTLFLILHIHALNGKTHNVDCREREVTAAYRCLGAEAVLVHTCAATHRSHLVEVTFGVVGSPLLTLVECGIKVQEVGEETACSNLTSELIEVVVAVTRQIAYATFLFPYLYGEDGSLAIAHATVCAVQQLTDDATALGRGVGTVVD